MPVPWRSPGDRAGGPTPFTTEWINEPPEPGRPRRLATTAGPLAVTTPAWLPSERVVTALLVLALVCSTVMLTGGGEAPLLIAASIDGLTGTEVPDGVGGVTAPSNLAGGGIVVPATESAAVTDGADDGATEIAQAPDPTEEPTPEPTATEAPTAAPIQITRPSSPPDDGSILPYYRVVSFYGQPHAETMGILGEYGVNDDLDGLREALEEQAAAYELADPNRPVKLAFEVIATVAQSDAMSDGSWLLSTDDLTIQRYIDYAAEYDMLVILDVQIGRRGVPGELDLIRKWLEYPQVHLALDPEFAMHGEEVPGMDIGHIGAADVLYAQQYLADLSAELGLPPKMLIVHQFHYTMIEDKDEVAPYPGVQLVIDMDGHGPPEMKYETYGVMNAQLPIEFNGIKLFYKFDQPILTPEDVVELNPIPDVVVYQ